MLARCWVYCITSVISIETPKQHHVLLCSIYFLVVLDFEIIRNAHTHQLQPTHFNGYVCKAPKPEVGKAKSVTSKPHLSPHLAALAYPLSPLLLPSPVIYFSAYSPSLPFRFDLLPACMEYLTLLAVFYFFSPSLTRFSGRCLDFDYFFSSLRVSTKLMDRPDASRASHMAFQP
ncbi:hypothetical protein F4810DRAFT_406065 [Camillea tinctor]|nr:hypothetical protein F4810DRAFT_406065 [Camillea tinctor]